MTSWVVTPGRPISGSTTVPGDKSLSHRALIFAALADGTSRITGLAPGADVRSTISCLRQLGVSIEMDGTDATVTSGGFGSFSPPDGVLDCGNSGTTIRLMSGLACRLPFAVTLDGDESLRRRPMDRVARPLSELGADISTTDGRAPVHVRPATLRATTVAVGVPSAQVKSALLLAALGIDGPTTITESVPTRDHTERLLTHLGAPISIDQDRITVEPFNPPATDTRIAGDPSSAAFLVAAGLLAGEVSIDNVCLNPGRTGFFDHCTRTAGHAMSWTVTHVHNGEPIGSVSAREAQLVRSDLDDFVLASMIDEVPIAVVLAAFGSGISVSGGAELRVKESDRIEAVASGLRAMGVEVSETPDGLTVSPGGRPGQATVDSLSDHRIAMAFAIAGLASAGPVTITGAEAADISWPGFADALTQLGAEVKTCT